MWQYPGRWPDLYPYPPGSTPLNPPAATISQCQYGLSYRKRTDLWGRLPPSFVPRRCNDPRQTTMYRRDRCAHITGRTETWMRDGNQRDPVWDTHTKMGAALRAKIPYGLSMAVCEAAERDI